MADLNINPIQIGALAALASQGVPNLQLQQTSGPLGALFASQVARANNQDTVKQAYAEMANKMITDKMKEDQLNARAWLQAQTTLQTNQNTVGATDRSTQSRQELELAKMQQQQGQFDQTQALENKKFDLDAHYKQVGLDQKQQELLHTQIKDAYDMKLKQDEFGLKVQQMAGNAYMASDKSPAARQAYVNSVSPTMDEAHVKILKDAIKDNNFDNYVAMNSTINAEVFKEKAKGGLSITTNPDGTTTVQMGGQGQTNAETAKSQDNIKTAQSISGLVDTASNQIMANKDMYTDLGGVSAWLGTRMGRNSLLKNMSPEAVTQYAENQDNALSEHESTLSQIKGIIGKSLSPRLLAGHQEFLNTLVPNPAKQDADSALIQLQTLKRLGNSIAMLNANYMVNGVPKDKAAYESGVEAAFADAKEYKQELKASVNPQNQSQPTAEDIAFTAQKYNMTEDQVRQKLGLK